MTLPPVNATAVVAGLDPDRQGTLFDSPEFFAGADVEGQLRTAGVDVRPLPDAITVTDGALRAAVVDHTGPAVFRGLADGWRARWKWYPSRLIEDHGNTSVTALMDLPSAGVLFPKDQHHYERTLSFAQFVEAMLAARAAAPCYLAYKRAEDIFPVTDYDFAGLLGPLATEPDTRAWMGSAGTRSMLHSDLKDNLFCQIWGEKHIILLPWAASMAAYPFPDNVVNSQLDLAAIDLKRYPRLGTTVLYSCSLHPGDILFIPRGWWHDIRAKTPSVSLNHWFGPPLSLRDYAGLLLHLGPPCWWATARDFVRSGVMSRGELSNFFFSPPSTGKRLFDAVRFGDFSRDNNPSTEPSGSTASK